MGVYHWKELVTQAELQDKSCKICQQFKNRNIFYGRLPLNNISELKPWYTVHVDLIGPYRNSTEQQQPGGATINIYFSLTCMTIIDPATGWFEIVKLPMFDIDEVTGGNNGYIEDFSASVIHLFNNTSICRYLLPRKVVLDNGSQFKQYFAPLLNDFDIKLVLTTVNNPQANALVDRVHQVMYNMLVTKDLDKKL